MKIAFISGKGGTGKSSISAAFVALSQKVVAVDCDVDASNLPLLFPCRTESRENFVSGSRLQIDAARCKLCGSCVEHCAFHALEMQDCGIRVDNFLCEACGLCQYLCPRQAISLQEEARSYLFQSRIPQGILVHGRLFPGDDNSGKMIARMRSLADEAMLGESVNLQILDGPPGTGCPVISTVTGTDCLVIVCEPTRSGIADFKRIHSLAVSFCRNIKAIINKCDLNRQECQNLLSLCRQYEIPVLAALPYDPNMIHAQLHHRTIIGHAPRSVSARELKKAYRALFPFTSR